MNMVIDAVGHGMIVGVILLIASVIISVPLAWWFGGVVSAVAIGAFRYATDISISQKQYMLDKEKPLKLCGKLKWFQEIVLENEDGTESINFNFCRIESRYDETRVGLALSSGAVDFWVDIRGVKLIRVLRDEVRLR